MLEYLAKSMYEGFVDAFNAIFGNMLESLNVTQSQFEDIVPALTHAVDILNAVGWSMLVLVLALFAIKSIMSPNSNTAEHPFYLVCRAVIAGAVIAFYRALFDQFFLWGQVIYNSIASIETASITEPLSGFQVALSAFSVVGFGFYLISIVMMIPLAWQFIKFALECIERVVILHIGICFAPLVAPTLVSKDTEKTFRSYLSFLMGQMILWWMSILFLKLVLSALAAFNTDSYGFFLQYFIIFALLKVAQKADNLLRTLGFKNIMSGTNSFEGMAAFAANTAKDVAGLAGRAITGGKGGHGPHKQDTMGAQTVLGYKPAPGSPESITQGMKSMARHQDGAMQMFADAAKAGAAVSGAILPMGFNAADHADANKTGALLTAKGAETMTKAMGDLKNATDESMSINKERQNGSFADKDAMSVSKENMDEHVASAAYSIADGVNSGDIDMNYAQLNEAMQPYGLSFSEEDSSATFTTPDGSTTVPLEPYTFTPKQDMSSMQNECMENAKACSAEGARYADEADTANYNPHLASGYAAMASYYQGQNEAMQLSINGSHYEAATRAATANESLANAASSFTQAGQAGLEAAKSAGFTITPTTNQQGQSQYTFTFNQQNIQQKTDSSFKLTQIGGLKQVRGRYRGKSTIITSPRTSKPKTAARSKK